MKHFTETLYDSIAQDFRIDRLYFDSYTGQQHLTIFHNAFLGRVMTLDGIVQTTERDEFVYHEMMAHVPLFAHPDPHRVLIIGGGDGAMLREVLRHPGVQATQVEIDQAVIDMAIEHLPNHSQGAYSNPRAQVVIADGRQFLRESADRWDVIICDSTDPIGPGEALFSEDFYALCHARLMPGGIVVTQNGVPFLQPDEVRVTHGRLRPHFRDSWFYVAPVPTYYGGHMAFAWACDDPQLRSPDLQTLTQRCDRAGFATRYYNPAVHLAAFALPQYILDLLDQADGTAT